jgi:hypothetical protein
MRLSLLVLVASAFASRVHAAPDIKYPYETVVEKDETYVRSGPSTKFYPTAKLRRGDRVVVHRPDPGGWLMIAPPPGSFSWVPAKYVQKSDTDWGTIKVNRVAARVGSFESDIREVFQRPLAEGDEVHILGEKMLAPESGNGPAELWYRIDPPRGEWRWVMGQDVAPVARQAEDRPAGDPFEPPVVSNRGKRSSPPVSRIEDDAPSIEKPIPHFANREYLDDSSGALNRETPLRTRPLLRKESKPGKPNSGSRNQEAILNELDRLDARFRSILVKPVLEWDFGQLEHDYHTLRGETDSANIQQMIDTRLQRIVDYRKTRTEEEDLARVQSETARRDAELAEIQRRQEAQLTSLRQPRFDGAGIVERSALTRRGTPRYVLLAPTGRVLAYLVPAPGVSLEEWIGRAAGVNGSRLPHSELKSDLITVNRLTPVRLVP